MVSFPQALSQLPLLSSLLNHSPDNNIAQPLTPHPLTQECPYPPIRSCPFPPPRNINTCCVNHPSGHFLQTQFWDTSPALGPADSWTIHGLWPDLCSGGFEQFCDSKRQHNDIPGAIKAAAPPELSDPLLAFMNEYWLALDGDNPHLWAHEWNKHGTCISTLDPACFTDDDDGDDDNNDNKPADVLDYVIQTTSLFKTLNTYSILAEAGILPSSSATYTLAELEDAVESSAHGVPVTFRCNRFGELDEVWYHFAVMGPLRTELAHSAAESASESATPLSASASVLASAPRTMDRTQNSISSPFLNESAIRQIFIPTSPVGGTSNCPSRGIKYRPKSTTGHPPPSPPSRTTTATATSTAPPFSGKGHLKVRVLQDPSTEVAFFPVRSPDGVEEEGCLIRLGDWYTSGTCATFKAQPDVVDPGHAPLFSLSSSYSPCVVNPVTQKFECTKTTSIQSIFSADPKNPTILSYRNSTTFYASHPPRRFEKVGIYAGPGDGERKIELEIQWVPS